MRPTKLQHVSPTSRALQLDFVILSTCNQQQDARAESGDCVVTCHHWIEPLGKKPWPLGNPSSGAAASFPNVSLWCVT